MSTVRSSRRARSWALLLAAIAGAGPCVVSLAPLGAEELPAQEGPADPAEGADLAAAEKALAQADALREEGRWNEAAEAYWAARKANLADYRTHRHYQDMCRRAGDEVGKLIADYDQLIAGYPKHLGFRILRLRLDPPAARLVALEALRAEHPRDPDLAVEVVRALLESGDVTRTQKLLKEVAGGLSGARAVEAVLLGVQADLRAGQRAEARKRLDVVLASQPDQRDLLLEAARLDLLDGQAETGVERVGKVLAGRPNHLAATLVQAELLSRLGKRDEAIAALERVLRTAKDSTDVLLPLAELTAQQETDAGYAKATELYAKVLEAKPNHPRAHYGVGWVLERQTKWKEAEDAYRKSLTEDPAWARALHSVGYCMFRQGRVSEAQIQIRRALDIDPNLVPAMLDLAATMDAQAKYPEALKQYEKVLKMKGQEENLRAIINSAFDHEAAGAFPKAQDMLLKAHKIAPDDVDVMVWLGDNSYFQERWKDAEKWYQKAVGIDEKSFFGWRGLGFTVGHQKRWADCVAALEKARALKPTDTDILMALGDIYMLELEDLEKAQKAYEEYVAAGGDDPSVPEVIEEIKKALGK
jgi:tetratricopeptide (TPR) repeat protein